MKNMMGRRRHKKRIYHLLLAASIFALLFYLVSSPPTLILEPVGGLGNQLFRYACAYSITRKLGIPLYLVIPPEKEQTNHYKTSNRPYALHRFRVRYTHSLSRVPLLLKFPFWPLSHRYLGPKEAYEITVKDKGEDFLQRVGNGKHLFLRGDDPNFGNTGFCQAEHYFKQYEKEIREMFQLRLTLEEEMDPSFLKWRGLIMDGREISIGVHVRRGYYAKKGRGKNKRGLWLTPFSFYQNAMRIMIEKLGRRKRLGFYIFSDEMDVVQGELTRGMNLPKWVSIHHVSCPSCLTTFQEFYLLQNCHHLIGSRTSFSWWAAYLKGRVRREGGRKIVIVPKPHPATEKDFHLSDQDKEIRDLMKWEWKAFYPPDWVVLDPYENPKEEL